MNPQVDRSYGADSARLRQQFHENYGSGRDFEGDALIGALVAAGKLVGQIIGIDAADEGFAAIARKLGYHCASDASWAQAFNDQAFGDAYTWPMGAKFHDLNCYAHYGITLSRSSSAAERERELGSMIAELSAFMTLIPFEAWGISPGDAEYTLRLARGRWALDMGQTIEPFALAEFGGVTEGRVRNLMAGTERAFTPKDGQIPAKQALAWLRSRRSFRPSRWKEQSSFEDLSTERAQIDEVLFVPVARDGSTFHPGLSQGEHYTVGAPGSEVAVNTFDDALLALQKQSIPTWKRPTQRGVWTYVSAVKWERLSRHELTDLSNKANVK